MNRRNVALIASLLAIGCGDDTSQTNNLTTTDSGSDVGVVSDMGAVDQGAPDLDQADVRKPDTGNPDDLGTDMADLGTDVGTDMGVDMGPPLPPLDITWPTNPTDYANTARVTYITSLVFPPVANNVASCCYDFGSKSKAPGIDNSFANLNQTLTGFGVSLNDVIADTLSSGALVGLLDHRALDGADDADGFVLAWLRGEFAGGTDFASAAAGNGTFLLDADSLDATGAAKLYFDPAQMTGGQMTAGPAALSLLLPVLVSSLELRVEGARITGDATIDANGVSYVNGTIAGYVGVQNVFDGLNAIIADQCACLGATGDFFTEVAPGNWDGQCITDPAAVCADEICVALGGAVLANDGYCNIASTLLPQLADIDTDGDRSTWEAISLGLEWEGVTGSVVGVAP